MYRVLTGALKVETLTIPIPNLPSHFKGTKVVQLSDFHYEGWGLSEELLAEAIAASNQAEPDLVLLTGDYVTQDPTPIHQLVQRLKYLQSRAGIYAILGNHDIRPLHSQAEITDALTSIGIRVLWNEVVYPLGAGLAVIGMAELFSGKFKPKPVFAQIPNNVPRIVLSHNPDTAALLQPWRVDLQLSGHTHGGQIVLPILGPVPRLLRKIRRITPKPLRPWIPFIRSNCCQGTIHWEWSEGSHQVGSNYLYVNRGLGTYFPGRLFCPPEVTVITLV